MRIATPGFSTVSGFSALDALFDEKLGEVGIVARRLAADADLTLLLAAGANDFGDMVFTVAFLSAKIGATISLSRSTSRTSWVRSFETDAKALKNLSKLRS